MTRFSSSLWNRELSIDIDSDTRPPAWPTSGCQAPAPWLSTNSILLFSLFTVSSSRQFVPPPSANNGSCTRVAIQQGRQSDKLPDGPSTHGHWGLQLLPPGMFELSWQNRPNAALSQVTGNGRLAGVDSGAG